MLILRQIIDIFPILGAIAFHVQGLLYGVDAVYLRCLHRFALFFVSFHDLVDDADIAEIHLVAKRVCMVQSSVPLCLWFPLCLRSERLVDGDWTVHPKAVPIGNAAISFSFYRSFAENVRD